MFSVESVQLYMTLVLLPRWGMFRLVQLGLHCTENALDMLELVYLKDWTVDKGWEEGSWYSTEMPSCLRRFPHTFDTYHQIYLFCCSHLVLLMF